MQQYSKYRTEHLFSASFVLFTLQKLTLTHTSAPDVSQEVWTWLGLASSLQSCKSTVLLLSTKLYKFYQVKASLYALCAMKGLKFNGLCKALLPILSETWYIILIVCVDSIKTMCTLTRIEVCVCVCNTVE